MYDHIAVAVLAIAAIIMLVAGIVTHLRSESTPTSTPTASPEPDLTSDAARRYHESNALGRN